MTLNNHGQQHGHSVLQLANQRPDDGFSRRSRGSHGERYSIKSMSSQISQLDEETDISLQTPISSNYAISQHDVPLNSGYNGRQPLLDDKPHRRLWTPFWLRKTTLIGFAVLFLAFSIALILVWHTAATNAGLSIRIAQNHYLWTYGPTAVLVVVISFWRQVDYYCKALTPWQEMRNGATKASRSMLLDYISPLQIMTLLAAVRNCHPAVAASVLGFGLLKLIVLFSTGLLVSVPTEFVDTSTPLILTTKFDASSWNATSALGSYSIIDPPSLDEGGVSASSDPLYVYYGVNQHGMSDPVGTKNGLAFQSYRLDNATRGQNTTKASAEVEVFVPYPACELTDVSISPENTNEFSNSSEGGALYLTIDSPTCHLGYTSFSTISIEKKNPRTEICEPRELTAAMEWVNCSLPAPPKVYNYSSPTYHPVPYNASDGDHRWLLTLSDIRYSQSFGISYPNNTLIPNITSWSRDVKGVTAILCTMRYTMMKMNLTYNFLEAELSSVVSIQLPVNVSVFNTLPGVSDSILNSAVVATLGSAATMLGSGNPEAIGNTPSGADPLFQLMKAASGADDSFEPMLNGIVMSQAARKVLGGIAAQYAQQNFIVPSQQATIGHAEYLENRLYVRPASLWFMVVGFVVMSCLAVTVLLTGPARVVPRDPASVGALATMLTSSEHVQGLLRGTGNLPIGKIRQKISKYGFRTTSYDAFRINVVYQSSSEDDWRSHQPTKIRSQWKPLAIRKPVLMLTLILPLLAIRTLEVMQQFSNRNRGVFTIKSKKAEYAAYYVPTLIMLCTATLFNNLDFNVATFTPFSALRKGSMPAKRSIMCCVLGKTPLVSLFQALRDRHFGSVLSNMAGLIGSLLTIIVSGLWVLDPAVPLSHRVIANRIDTWNTSWSDSHSNDSGAGNLLSLVQYQGLKDPPWTWDELAFPRIGTSNASGDLGLASVSNASSAFPEYTLTMPALRGSLNCTVLTGEEMKIENSFSPAAHPGTYITATALLAQVELPPQCLASLPVGQKYVNFTIDYYEIWGDPTNGSYIANFYNLHVPCTDYVCYGDYSSESESELKPDNPNGCPSIGFAFGYIRVNHTTLDNVTAAICYQNLQEVETEVTYVEDLTSGLVSESRPPKPNESTVKLLTNGTEGFTSFPYRPEANLASSLEKSGASSNNTNGQGLDAVFDFIVNGPDGTPPHQLLGPANADKLVNTVNKLYRKYMAQVINLNFRRHITSPNDGSLDGKAEQSETYPGMLLIPTPRLKVNAGSKLTLQILLAVMVCFGGLAFVTTEMRGTLPHNPCSIAGTMSLLAGSEMCERNKIPEQSEWASDKELDRLFGGQGWLYSLGWWEKLKRNDFGQREEEEEEERFGIDIGRAEWR